MINFTRWSIIHSIFFVPLMDYLLLIKITLDNQVHRDDHENLLDSQMDHDHRAYLVRLINNARLFLMLFQ